MCFQMVPSTPATFSLSVEIDDPMDDLEIHDITTIISERYNAVVNKPVYDVSTAKYKKNCNLSSPKNNFGSTDKAVHVIGTKFF